MTEKMRGVIAREQDPRNTRKNITLPKTSFAGGKNKTLHETKVPIGQLPRRVPMT